MHQAKSCSVEGCDGRARARGYCETHYSRWRAGRPMDAPVKRQNRGLKVACSVEGCEGSARYKGMCTLHYHRYWEFGDPGPAERVKVRRGPGKCKADHCQRARVAKGYCELHYRKLRRGVAIGSPQWLAEPQWSEVVTYGIAHVHIVAERGKASEYTCSCGQPAKQWAYQHNDPDALVSPLGHPYSLLIFDCYEPMCVPCHGRLDKNRG